MWKPPELWRDGTCWIIGGGPSILQQFRVPSELQKQLKHRQVNLSALSPYLSVLHSKHVIGINMAYQLGSWLDFLFFGDPSWFSAHRWALAQASMLKVTCSPHHYGWSLDNDECIKPMVRHDEKQRGICTEPGYVAWNKNSGAASISLAVQLGCTRINLVGFDASPDSQGFTHWHGDHRHKAIPVKDKTFKRIASTFGSIMQDAKELGIEIFNTNKDSEIAEVPYRPLEELLKEDTHEQPT